MLRTICNWWKSCDHQRQLMQIIGVTIYGALSRPASHQEASQENWFNLVNRNKVLAKSWYIGPLVVYFTFPILSFHFFFLTAHQSNRVCNALALLQCVASHPETRSAFLLAHIPLYLYPFLHTVSKTRPFEYLRLTSLGVIGKFISLMWPIKRISVWYDTTVPFYWNYSLVLCFY